MYVDTQLELSDAQAVTATAISTNVIDLLTTTTGAATLDSKLQPNSLVDVGDGEDIYLIVSTQTAATDTGSDATLTITLETDSAVGLGSSTVVASTAALAFAAFSPAGTTLWILKLPPFDYKRYLGIRYTVASGPLTAGNFDAYLTIGLQKNKIYKTAISVQ